MAPMLKLKSGTDRTQLFIAHGVAGNVWEFCELVKHIDPRRPVFGLQAKGSDAASNPLDCIEDMAEFHHQAIKQLQPHGPYFLAGHSLGGLVALEIARRVLESGDNPGVLVLIDSYPHLKHLALAQQVRLTARLAVRRGLGVKKSHETSWQTPKGSAQLQVPAEIQSSCRRRRECDYKALERYKPRFYAGKIHFVRAAVASIFPDDPAAIWGHFAKEFQVETAFGDHFEMLTTHAWILGSLLSRYGHELCD